MPTYTLTASQLYGQGILNSFSIPSGTSFDSDYQAILDKAVSLGYTLPSSNAQTLQNTLLTSLKTDGVWNKLDIFYVFAVDNNASEFTTINWKNPNALVNLPTQSTLINAPAFTNKAGFTGNGADNYINTNYNPATQSINYTLNNASRYYFPHAFVGTTRVDGTNATSVNALVVGVTNAHRINAGTNKSPAQKEDEDRREKLRNATVYDDITESLTTVAKSFLLIVYILVGLRCASFAVNENLHLGLEYRILIFIYTFIFTPIFGPYYLWKGIENYIWSTPLTPYEGFFPLYPYDKADPLTLNRRLYGYLDSPEFQARIQLKKDTIVAERDATVVSKGLRAKIIEEHSV
jgi:hypothetical protein